MLNSTSQAGANVQQSDEVEVEIRQPNLHKTICCTLLLFPCGTLVRSKYGNIEGMITAQSLRFDKVQYEVSYFNNGDQKSIWMNENEFTTDVKKYTIGFVK